MYKELSIAGYIFTNRSLLQGISYLKQILHLTIMQRIKQTKTSFI